MSFVMLSIVLLHGSMFVLQTSQSTRDAYLKNKKLSHRRGTARRSMLVSLCYVSRGIRFRNDPVSKNDLQGL